MSTNYYFNLDTACKFCKSIEIHIGKRSAGWEPSFQKTEHYSSVEEIKEFYNENKECIKIINEYGDVLTFEELEKDLIHWNKDRDDIFVHSLDMVGLYRDSEGYYFVSYDFS